MSACAGTVSGERFVASPEVLRRLSSAILDLEDWLAAARVPHVFIGGVAVALLGRPRTTNDIDCIVIVPDDEFADFLRAAASAGFPPRLEKAAAFARANRVFLLRHVRSGTPIDLSAGSLDFERDVIRNARMATAFGRRIPLPRPADLVILKAVAARPQDYADIATVVEQNPRLDRNRIMAIVGRFAEVLEAPELVSRVEPVLRPARRRPRR